MSWRCFVVAIQGMLLARDTFTITANKVGDGARTTSPVSLSMDMATQKRTLATSCSTFNYPTNGCRIDGCLHFLKSTVSLSFKLLFDLFYQATLEYNEITSAHRYGGTVDWP